MILSGHILVYELADPSLPRKLPEDENQRVPSYNVDELPRNVAECYAHIYDQVELEAIDKDNEQCVAAGNANLSFSYERTCRQD